MSGTIIKAGAQVKYSIIDSDSVISENAKVGEEIKDAKGIAVVGSGLIIAPNSTISSDAMINNESIDGITIIQK